MVILNNDICSYENYLYYLARGKVRFTFIYAINVSLSVSFHGGFS